MRVLVTGASGLLGINYCLRFSGEQDLIGITHSVRTKAFPCENFQYDLSIEKDARKLIEKHKPDVLLNFAAMANLESCERDPEKAGLLNAELPGWLSEECGRHSIPFMHISTDAVFDGEKECAYIEQDVPNPQSTYAKTKLDGEGAVSDTNPDAIISRVNFYGYSLSGKRSLAEVFLNAFQNKKQMFGFTDVLFSPLYVIDLVEILWRMIDKGLYGLFHVASPEHLSKYEFGKRIAHLFGFDESTLTPISVEEATFLTAKRSRNLVMDPAKLQNSLNSTIPAQNAGLERFHAHFQDGYAAKIYSLLEE